MAGVVAQPGLDGLPGMLADLVRANLEREPAREGLLRGRAGRINVRARDVPAVCGMVVSSGQLHVLPEALPHPDLDIESDSGTLMELTSVPLRWGLPDAGTEAGREILRKLFRGDLKVRGMLLAPGLMARLNKLLSVA